MRMKNDRSLKLWYNSPASDWNEALPIGNGRLGGMVFGRISHETIQLNEISVFSGGAQDSDNEESLAHLQEIRSLLFEGKYRQAQQLAEKYIVCKGKGSNLGNAADEAFGAYQTLGELIMDFEHTDEGISCYKRELSLENAIAKISYTCGDREYIREIFSTAAHQAIIIKISCSKPGSIIFDSTIKRERQAATKVVMPDHIVMQGGFFNGEGIKFEAHLKIVNEGGTLSHSGEYIRVEDADSVILIIAAGTNYRGNNPYETCLQQITEVSHKQFDVLLKAHIDDYRKLFNRVDFDLGESENLAFPTNERLEKLRQGYKDLQLVSLYFQYGRYLLISSSRTPGLPANLQGIWCKDINPPWNCDYHLNINLQMNYWPAEITNLSELHKPLFEFIESLVEPGRRTARIHYGASGWVVHTISNIWGYTSPGEHPGWGSFIAAGAWLCRHLWEHYDFNRDKEFLRWAYPIMKECAEFYVDFLVEDRKHGYLITAPSNSPENTFITPEGEEVSICAGPFMDTEIIWDLFTNCIKASKILNIDEEFANRLEKLRDRLPPLKIGRYGQLQEWLEDFEELDPGHRHISHLYALYPGDQITSSQTPELECAAKTTLERRLTHGGGHTGWSRAWIINFWARLRDGQKCYENLMELLKKSTHVNLLDDHPPFQIDGNFGAAAGIAEMLVQSHSGEIVFLPALPKEWESGFVKGLRTRGGFEVSITWDDGKLTEAEILSLCGEKCSLSYTLPISIRDEHGRVYKTDFETCKGRKYFVDVYD